LISQRRSIALFLNHSLLLVGLAVATSALWVGNRYGDRVLAEANRTEEAEERARIEELKAQLPLRVLKRYGLTK
jgi:hypothetical protein